MNITTTYEISSSAEFGEAVERLGGECMAVPCFDEDNRTITIVDEEEWECDDDFETISGETLNPHPDESISDRIE